MVMSKRPRVGRPAKAESEQLVVVPVRLPQHMIERLEAEMQARGDRPSRSVLIRQFIDEGLSGVEKGRK